jgi:hypothetical protein
MKVNFLEKHMLGLLLYVPRDESWNLVLQLFL